MKGTGKFQRQKTFLIETECAGLFLPLL